MALPPPKCGEIGAFYPVFERSELSAAERHTTTLIETVQDTNDGRPVTPSRTPSDSVQDNVTGHTALPSRTPESLHDQAYLERLLDVLERERAILQQALADSHAEKQRLLDLLHEEQRQWNDRAIART